MTTDERGFAATEPGDTFVEDKGGGARVQLPDAGYLFGDVLGRGGMGEVVGAEDKRIGRPVAIKRMKDQSPSASAIRRFLREARIQARLDHPAIVPVHELGVDDRGRPFFTMKRLAGTTLADQLTQDAPLQPLLRTFIGVCLAIEFAHARGVVHRDLKPSNIMVGDYGEVYVLDWGVARVIDEKVRAPTGNEDIDSLEEGTKTGDLLGTPGYMSPEQVRGQDVRAASDVYALGAILFEILARTPLHPRGTAGLATTLSTPTVAPRERRPDVPPELDAACTAALAEEATTRPTARELADRVQRYLDGDRDLERRRQLAAEYLERARAAVATRDPERRAEAMQAAGQALALDPESADAARLVTGLIVEPPPTLPAELARTLEADDRSFGVLRLRFAAISMMFMFVLLAFAPFIGIRSWSEIATFYGALTVVIVVFWALYKAGRTSVAANMLGTLVLSLAFSRVLGPWILTPIVIVGASFAISANPWLEERRLIMIGWVWLLLLAPVLLEAAGIFAPTYFVGADGILSISRLLVGASPADPYALVVGHLIVLTSVALFAARANQITRKLRHEVRIQAWHLGQLLPAGRLSVR